MPTFTFTSPEGKSYDVQGPEGSTKEQAFGILQKQIGARDPAAAFAKGESSLLIPGTPPQPKPKEEAPVALSDRLAGIPETATSLLTSIPAGIAGNVAGAADTMFGGGFGTPAATKRGSERAESVAKAMTYAPRGETGRAVSEGVGDFLNRSGIQGLNPGLMIPEVPRLGAAGGAKQAKLDALKSTNSVLDKTRDVSQESSYITPPEWGPKAAASGLAGKAKAEKIISEKNAENATQKLGKEVGVPEGAPLSTENIAAQKREAGAAYDALSKGVGPYLHPGDPFKEAMGSTLKKINEEIAFNPEAAKPLIAARNLIKSFAEQKEFPTESTMRAIQRQRKLAKDDFRKGDSEMGSARMGIANQLENMIEENLTLARKEALVTDFRAARTKFAQLYLLDRIVNESTGKVDLSKLASLSERPQYKGVLTGAFKEAADFAKAYRKAAQKPTGEAAPRLTVFDGMFGLGALFSGHPGLAAAEIGGRIGVPMLAERGMLQNRTPGYQARQLPPWLAPGTALGATAGSQIPPPPE